MFTLLEHCSIGTLLLMQFVLGSRAFKQASHLSVLSMHSCNISLYNLCLPFLALTLVPGIRRFSQSLAAVTFPLIFFDTVHPGDFLSLACQRHLVVDDVDPWKTCQVMTCRGTKSFIDCDDLNDLTRLFSYVGQDRGYPEPWNSCGVEAWSVAQVSSEH